MNTIILISFIAICIFIAIKCVKIWWRNSNTKAEIACKRCVTVIQNSHDIDTIIDNFDYLFLESRIHSISNETLGIPSWHTYIMNICDRLNKYLEEKNQALRQAEESTEIKSNGKEEKRLRDRIETFKTSLTELHYSSHSR